MAAEFSDAPGDPRSFAWPTTHAEALAHLDHFLAERFRLFGPYEDALSTDHPYLYHALITPMLNVGLLTPAGRTASGYRELRHTVQLPRIS